jgi:hypothetical protein
LKRRAVAPGGRDRLRSGENVVHAAKPITIRKIAIRAIAIWAITICVRQSRQAGAETPRKV